MSLEAVCYLERAGSGSVLRRIRVVAHGAGIPVDRTWNAPALSSVTSTEGPATSEAVTATTAAARWVADTLHQLNIRRIARVCVDPDGSVCTWLSATSADPGMIAATLMQPDTDEGGGGAAARLLALGAGSANGFSPGEASVQALATLDRPSGPGGAPKWRRRGGGGSAPGTADGDRQRYAVVAVPDAPVRVFLDELDARGVEVEQTVSLWHAMAEAWDPGRDSQGADGGAFSERVVASVSPSSAIILVDPIGRLVWAWSQAGQLVAGGCMRLRTADRQSVPDDADGTTTARRIGSATGATGGEAQTIVEFTEADTGRLAMDWLAWSAQLGHCPQRVACIGPAPATDATAGSPDPALIAESLGKVWPGATIAVAVHADPVGATMARLVAAGELAPDSSDPESEHSVAVGADDPRAAMVGLSNRPGRADRGMYAWMALGVTGAACLLGALGWQLHQGGKSATAAIDSANTARKEALASIEETVKGISLLKPKDASDAIQTKLDELRKQAGSLKPAKPLLAEANRIVKAVENHDNVKIDKIELNQVTGVVELTVPNGDVGPAIVSTLIAMPNILMTWSGSQPPGPVDAPRRYVLTGFPRSDAARPGGNN